MIVTLPCGHVINDETHSTHCYGEGWDGGHYALGTSPGSFCKRCDLYRPCLCPEPERRLFIPGPPLAPDEQERVDNLVQMIEQPPA